MDRNTVTLLKSAVARYIQDTHVLSSDEAVKAVGEIVESTYKVELAKGNSEEQSGKIALRIMLSEFNYPIAIFIDQTFIKDLYS